MDKTTIAKFAMHDDVVLLVGRLLLAWIFVHEGFSLTMNFDAASSSMAQLGVPAFALVATIALQLAAGLMIAVGWYAQLGAAGLGVFCLITAVLFHTKFAVRNELLHFEKDLAIAGGMFVLTVRGAGRWSLNSLRRPKSVVSALARTSHASNQVVDESAHAPSLPLVPESFQILRIPTMFPPRR
jgi:putative oxidoreductase